MSDFERCVQGAGEAFRAGSDFGALSCCVGALEALAAERAAERRGAAYRITEKLGDGGAFTVGDAINIISPLWANSVATATARVAMAREAAPEPVSVGHWGMHA